MRPQIGEWYRRKADGRRYEVVQVGPARQVNLRSPHGDYIKTDVGLLRENWEITNPPSQKKGGFI